MPVAGLVEDVLGVPQDLQQGMDLDAGTGRLEGLDLRQAESNYAGAEAAIAAIERSRSQAENALSILVGRNPGAIARAPRAIATAAPPLLAVVDRVGTFG